MNPKGDDPLSDYLVQDRNGVLTVRDKATLNQPKSIRFITPDYQELFTVPDGDPVLVCFADGTKKAIPCYYLDDYHFMLDFRAYHICEFAERMEQIGAKVGPFPEKRIIWSNYDLNLDDWREDLLENEPDLTEDELYVRMVELNGEYLEDDRANLDIVCGEEIIGIVDIGKWNGRFPGYREIKSGKISDCLYSGYDYTEWYVDREGEFRATMWHHDGVNYVRYRKFKEDVDEWDRNGLKSSIVEGKATDADIEKMDSMIDKRNVAIIENPFYTVMNEPNSMAARLLRKLSLMDIVDERNYSGKLDLIVQLPYSTRTEIRKNQADKRLKDIQDQLVKSPYGIAYTDATEKIIQLNRSLENQFLKQIEYFQNLLYSQFGITQSIMDGTADENVMQNYINRTIEPICSAIVNELKRKFLTKTARSQGQSFAVFNDPFRLVPATKVAELADKLTRNEIMTSNEVRQCIGLKPSNDPGADELRNKNINQSTDDILMRDEEVMDYDTSMQQLDDIDKQLAELEKML